MSLKQKQKKNEFTSIHINNIKQYNNYKCDKRKMTSILMPLNL